MKNTTTVDAIVKALEDARASKKRISAWENGVYEYAFDMLDNLDSDILGYFPTSPKSIESVLLNGASNWSAYSWGGCAYIYDSDIAEMLCTPSELRKTRNGERRPNSREDWLDVQARALFQACSKIKRAARVAATC